MSRIIFAGTPDFAAVHLQALLNAGIRPVAVYSQPDRPAGRGHKLQPSAVKKLALEHGLEVRTPLNFKNEADIAAFRELEADLAVVVAYGLLLPEAVFAAPRLGSINVHASLLPRWRGAAPIQRALLAGDAETGVTIMQVGAGLDTGDMFCTRTLPIAADDTAESLFNKLAALGAQTLVKVLPDILSGQITPNAQDETRAVYARKLSKAESPLDFSRPAEELALQVRGLYPWPAASFAHQGVVYKVFAAEALPQSCGAPGTIGPADKRGLIISCGRGSLLISQLQAPGKKACDAAAFVRSHQEQFKAGVILQP